MFDATGFLLWSKLATPLFLLTIKRVTQTIFLLWQVLIKLIKPYTQIKISFISGELNIDPAEVEMLLISCILDSTINGRIDQVSITAIVTMALPKLLHK